MQWNKDKCKTFSKLCLVTSSMSSSKNNKTYSIMLKHTADKASVSVFAIPNSTCYITMLINYALSISSNAIMFWGCSSVEHHSILRCCNSMLILIFVLVVPHFQLYVYLKHSCNCVRKLIPRICTHFQ